MSRDVLSAFFLGIAMGLALAVLLLNFVARQHGYKNDKGDTE